MAGCTGFQPPAGADLGRVRAGYCSLQLHRDRAETCRIKCALKKKVGGSFGTKTTSFLRHLALHRAATVAALPGERERERESESESESESERARQAVTQAGSRQTDTQMQR